METHKKTVVWKENPLVSKIFFGLVVLLLWGFSPLVPQSHCSDYNAYKQGLSNFVTCEMTRTGAKSYFQGKPFTITMVELFNIQQEGDLTILTGAVRCSVQKKFHVLHVALGLETILGKEKVSYFLMREKDFFILATELLKYPYKERCPWARYWIDID